MIIKHLVREIVSKNILVLNTKIKKNHKHNTDSGFVLEWMKIILYIVHLACEDTLLTLILQQVQTLSLGIIKLYI